jgi:RNA recognition motif-containing protein
VKPKPAAVVVESKEDKAAEASAIQIKERKQRTCFVGNVPVEASAKQLQKVFKGCGKIEKIWFRSICITEESKKPQRAKIISKEYGVHKDSKNAYVLFQDKASATEAKLKLN